MGVSAEASLAGVAVGQGIEGLFRRQYGSSGLPYPIPSALQGGTNLGFMFLPNYRAWVVVASSVPLSVPTGWPLASEISL